MTHVRRAAANVGFLVACLMPWAIILFWLYSRVP